MYQWRKYLSSIVCFFFSSRRRHTRFDCDWSSDVCSSDLRVATKYPRLTRAFFAETGQGVEVITVSGSVEVAPLLGLSHWIVDLVDTGRTLRESGLVERAPILDVGAVVVVNRASQKLRLEEHQRLLQALHDATT